MLVFKLMNNGIDLNGTFMSTLLFLETKAYGAIKTLKCTQGQVIVCDKHTRMLVYLSLHFTLLCISIYIFSIKEKIIERLLCSYTHCPLCIFVNQPCIKCLFTWLINILLKSWFSDLRFLLFFFFLNMLYWV